MRGDEKEGGYSEGKPSNTNLAYWCKLTNMCVIFCRYSTSGSRGSRFCMSSLWLGDALGISSNISMSLSLERGRQIYKMDGSSSVKSTRGTAGPWFSGSVSSLVWEGTRTIGLRTGLIAFSGVSKPRCWARRILSRFFHPARWRFFLSSIVRTVIDFNTLYRAAM